MSNPDEFPYKTILDVRYPPLQVVNVPEVVGAVGDFVPAFERHRKALGDRLITAPDAEALGPRLKAALQGNEIVLLKASRGVALERVLRYLT